MTTSPTTKIAIIGAGTIGLSLTALHLVQNPTCQIAIHDPRPDLQSYITTHLPTYLPQVDKATYQTRISLVSDLSSAVKNATIIQEQGPEETGFKQRIWAQIEGYAPPNALFWSSTSGIPASEQNREMKDKSRLVVVHPYNPPHVMPLLEVVPAPSTSADVVERTLEYWRTLGRTPVVVRKECTGFVANRLAFALFREACSLVAQDVVSVEDLDAIVSASMGPRWSVAGPFKSYHAGGGEGGLKSFMEKIGGTVQACWSASDEDVKREGIEVGNAWQDKICRQANESYGVVDTSTRDETTKKVLNVVGH
ncbi:l-carnitine dehydrogenase [Acrodontium crateriforme]|uniref:L-gulonate 3-dehydrogenase n=1 Tax=Acrodontium crateriforme TaxID=150365 RepID=A0AAQ3R9U6_9PEZI|nr:l-carnitine dehydrogenase [Acrodontium crateriforme]